MYPANQQRIEREHEQMLSGIAILARHGLLETNDGDGSELADVKRKMLQILYPNELQVSTHELSGRALDHAIAVAMFSSCEDFDGTLDGVDGITDLQGQDYSPTTNDAQLNDVIEEYSVAVWPDQEEAGTWLAAVHDGAGPTLSGKSIAEAALRAAALEYHGPSTRIPNTLLHPQREVSRDRPRG